MQANVSLLCSITSLYTLSLTVCFKQIGPFEHALFMQLHLIGQQHRVTLANVSYLVGTIPEASLGRVPGASLSQCCNICQVSGFKSLFCSYMVMMTFSTFPLHSFPMVYGLQVPTHPC